MLILARNVNDAYRQGMLHLASVGQHKDSRNGGVITAPTPVITVYDNPQERVLLNVQRDANPFFHLFEALWMLAGRNDLAFLTQFISRFAEFSDNGETLHGAYGYRWRNLYGPDGPTNKDNCGHGFDQLNELVAILKANPDDRRAMLQIWDARLDLGHQSKDIPCNTMVNFNVRKNSSLSMTVFNRSNDIIWGCYGANAVHFSFLQEYIAQRVGLAVGQYTQISCDFHAYTQIWDKYWPMKDVTSQPYDGAHAFSGDQPAWCYHSLISDPEEFDRELFLVVNSVRGSAFHLMETRNLSNRFFRVIAQPMYSAFRTWKVTGDARRAAAVLEDHMSIPDHVPRYPAQWDWLAAGHLWLTRRAK